MTYSLVLNALWFPVSVNLLCSIPDCVIWLVNNPDAMSPWLCAAVVVAFLTICLVMNHYELNSLVILVSAACGSVVGVTLLVGLLPVILMILLYPIAMAETLLVGVLSAIAWLFKLFFFVIYSVFHEMWSFLRLSEI